MNPRTLIPLLLLAACETAPVVDMPPAGIAMIEVATGGTMFGSNSTRIYADGTIVRDSAISGSAAQHSVLQGSPAGFTAAAAVIADEGKRTKSAMKPHPDMCMDYGTDTVRADPPIAGFDFVASSCPDDAVTTLTNHVLSALASKNEP